MDPPVRPLLINMDAMSRDPTHARHWEFLFPWFECLRWRLRPHFDARHDRISSDPVRVGLDVADWWILVDVAEDYEDDDYEAVVRRIREALLMVGAFARINRVCCWQFLQIVSKFERAAWMDLAHPAFYPQFVVDVTCVTRGLGFRKMKMVNATIDGLMMTPPDNASEDFLKDWARVLVLCGHMSWLAPPQVPLRVLVDLYLVDDDNHIEYCLKIAQGIRCIRCALPGKSAKFSAEQLITTVPRLQVKTMDMYFGEIQYSVDMARALRELTDLGIPLHIVELPTFVGSMIEISAESRLAWCGFLCSLTGQNEILATATSSVRLVRRLVVPEEYGEEPLRSSFFSALVGVRGVEELDVKRDPRKRNREHGDYGALFWAWIGAVIIGDPLAPPAIKTLSISGAIVGVSAIKTLTQFKSRGSLGSLTNMFVPQLSNTTLAEKTIIQQRTTIVPGTDVDVHLGPSTVSHMKTNVSLDAIAVFGTSNEQRVVLVVPGIGICSTVKTTPISMTSSQPSVPNNIESSLVNLSLPSMCRDQGPAYLNDFIRAVGGESLRGLHIDLLLTDFVLLETMQSCPNVEALSFACVPESSFFESLLALKSRGSSFNFKSLHLLNVGANNLDAVRRLLVALKLSEDDSASAIERVCLTVKEGIGIPDPGRLDRPQVPMHASLGFHAVIPQLLDQNTRLTHFWCLSSPSRSFVQWGVERHHGRVLVEPLAMEQSAALAFLHVLDQKSDGRQRQERLDDGVKALILSFTAERQRRSVLCEDPFRADESPFDTT